MINESSWLSINLNSPSSNNNNDTSDSHYHWPLIIHCNHLICWLIFLQCPTRHVSCPCLYPESCVVRACVMSAVFALPFFLSSFALFPHFSTLSFIPSSFSAPLPFPPLSIFIAIASFFLIFPLSLSTSSPLLAYVVLSNLLLLLTITSFSFVNLMITSYDYW